MQQNQKSTSLNYHLAQAITNFIYSSGDTIIKRIDDLDVIFGLTLAMVGWADNAKGDMQKIDDDIMEMLNNYEAVVDNPGEKRSGVIEKRVAYKKEIRIKFRELMTVCYRNKLLDNSVMAKIEGKRWGDSN